MAATVYEILTPKLTARGRISSLETLIYVSVITLFICTLWLVKKSKLMLKKNYVKWRQKTIKLQHRDVKFSPHAPRNIKSKGAYISIVLVMSIYFLL